MKQAYVVLHRSPNGEGSGYTIAVASCPTMARMMVWQYICRKPEGFRQCTSSNLLEIELLEEFSLFSNLAWTLLLEEHGVKCEYSLAPQVDGEAEPEPKLVAYMPDEKSYLTFGGGGHEREYLVNVAGHDHNNYIPNSMSKKLEELLPGFWVSNRGSRIEIVGSKPYGFRDDDKVTAAVKQVVGENLTVTL